MLLTCNFFHFHFLPNVAFKFQNHEILEKLLTLFHNCSNMITDDKKNTTKICVRSTVEVQLLTTFLSDTDQYTLLSECVSGKMFLNFRISCRVVFSVPISKCILSL